ncbi:hypothetical protein A2U01_0051153, partial [Trifolium medium]|nr:hypothetical protein [Trifolium medium]
MANFKAVNVVQREYTWQQKKKLFRDAKQYWWDDPYLYKEGSDGVIQRCLSGAEARDIMWHCHSSDYGGHHSGNRTAVKILYCGFWWPTLFHDCNKFVRNCDKCQRT